MSIYQLENEVISISVDSRGAELKSLKRKDTGTEYMWCGDAKYWGRTSPILFPFVGGVKNKEYRTQGRTYSMTQHGFARDMEFEPLSSNMPSQHAPAPSRPSENASAENGSEIWFQLCSSQETLANYPFAFLLKLGYRIQGNRVTVLWQVENPGKEVLHFSIGGHPAFNCPIEKGTNQTDYFLDFGNVDKVVSTKISKNGLALDEKETYTLDNGKLPISEDLFDNDALVIEGNQTDTAALCRADGTRYVTITMDAPLFGIWSPAGKQAPFVCIEPWHGRCDNENFQGTLEERQWGNQVSPGETWKASYTIAV